METRIAIWTVFVMIVTACAVEEVGTEGRNDKVAQPDTEAIMKTFTVEFAPQTRTSISIDRDGGGSVKWQAGDAISIIQASSNKMHVIKASDISEDGTTATLAISVKANLKYYAVYPYNEKYRFVDIYSLTDFLPSVQDGTFGGCHISLAEFTSASSAITFNNKSNIVAFTQESDDIARIIFEDNSGSKIVKGASAIEVTTGSAGQFFIGLRDCTLDHGFTIKAFDGSDNCIGMAFSANSLTLKEAAGEDLGSLDEHLIPVVAVSYLSGLDEDADCVVIGTVVGLEDSTFSISDGTGTIEIPNISGLSLSIGDVVTICGSKDGGSISNAACLSHKANDSFLSQSDYGAYSTTQGTAFHSYDEFLDQIGVGEGAFRVVNPNSTKWLSVTGLPSDPVVGSTCTVQVEQNYSGSMPSSFSTQVTVLKVEDDAASQVQSAKKVWLITSEGQGLVVRINQ